MVGFNEFMRCCYDGLSAYARPTQGADPLRISRLGYRLISLNHDNTSAKNVDPAYLVQAALIERFKLEAPVIIDVGSNTGQVYQIYRRVFPAARIYCFEPFRSPCNPLLGQLLATNLSRFTLWLCRPVRVGQPLISLKLPGKLSFGHGFGCQSFQGE
jgi:hypothetical protein